MLNTGLSLRKPGESAYSRFLRFLIANQSIGYSKLKEEFKKAKISKKYLKSDNIALGESWLIKSSTKYENKYLNLNLIPKQKYFSALLKRYRPDKACNTCMRVGFHSDVFDYKWAAACPIHKEKLTSRCKLCNTPWSTAYQLLNNSCPICGPQKNIKDIHKHDLSSINEYKKIDEMLNSLEVNKIRTGTKIW